MDSQKVDMFMLANSQYFNSHQLLQIRDALQRVDDAKWPLLQTIEYKNPTTMLIISILGGSLGIDRFVVGDTGLGVAKLLTLGGCGIWYLVDLFLIMGIAREKNMMALQRILY